jgi:hypothetical protein
MPWIAAVRATAKAIKKNKGSRRGLSPALPSAHAGGVILPASPEAELAHTARPDTAKSARFRFTRRYADFAAVSGYVHRQAMGVAKHLLRAPGILFQKAPGPRLAEAHALRGCAASLSARDRDGGRSPRPMSSALPPLPRPHFFPALAPAASEA